VAPETTKLPLSVTTPGDVNRLLRELETIDETFLQLRLRQPGTDVKLPKTSQFLDQIVSLNGLNLLQAADRLQLRQILQAVRERAPVLHMSFSADPSPDFMAKIILWLRQEINPFTLITTGLQPSIGAGCVIRTVNRSFDFSLAQNFVRQRQLLIDGLAAPPPVVPAPAPEVPA
jgi:hypothetical protein